MLWLSDPTTECPQELRQAASIARMRTIIDCYRSRTNVTAEHIQTAFSWMRMPIIVEDRLGDINRNYIKYSTRAIKRGIAPEEAVTAATSIIGNATNCGYDNIFLTLNTATAAAASEAVKRMLDESEAFEELDVRTMLISSPTHKIHIYKQWYDTSKRIYVILNNLDTPGVLFKISAAIMLDQNKFLENTSEFAEAWMSGNPTTIFEVVTNYYKEYNENKQKREFETALESMVKGITETKRKAFEKEIKELEQDISYKFDEIRQMNLRLNQVKGNYLLSITVDEDERITDLQRFLESCKDKISYINAENNILTILYRTSLMYFEEELLDHYFNSTRSNVVTRADLWIQQLLKDIFKNKSYTLLIESGVTINLIDKRFAYKNVTDCVTRDSMLGIPNPHHKYYNCWGDNTSNIIRALTNSDFLTAITTIFAAMSGLNISDTAVMEKFITDEIHQWNNVQCLKNNETGEIITIEEYKRRFRNASNEVNEQADTGNDI